MSRYEKEKAAAREEAIDWQLEITQRPVFWSELAEATERFEKLGRRYGLTREFKENGII